MTEFASAQEQISEFSFVLAGGLNTWDQADQLVRRSHQRTANGGWQQIAPMESPAISNIEFFQDGWGTRLGSVSSDDLRSVMVAGDTLLDGFEWRNPASQARILIVISSLTIYTNQSGSWAQLLHANSGGTAYTHGSTITKWMFSQVDGHLLITTDGGTNRIRVYRSGTTLDDPLGNNTSTATVNVTSNSGQKVLSITATTSFQPGDRIAINLGGAREEFQYVASISAGVSLTLMDNLTNTHTSGQADVVQVRNQWTEAFSTSTKHVVTGDWDLGTYLGVAVRDIFAFGKGNTYLSFTPPARTASSGIWDILGTEAGFYQARAPIVGITSYTPNQGSINDQLLYIFTTAGAGVLTGFQDYDQVMDLNAMIGGVPLNHRCIVGTKNWVVYLTQNKDIEGINGKTVINLGRRMKTLIKTGPLDAIDITQSALSAFGFYSIEAEKVFFHANSGNAAYVNDQQFQIDFRLGEPLLGEGREAYEQHVRCLAGSIISPSTNAWFYGMFQRLGNVCGVTQSGILYTVGGSTQPRSDLGTLAIPNYWDTPWFNAGSSQILILLQNLISRFKKTGNWNVTIGVMRNYDPTIIKSFDVLQIGTDDATYGTSTYGGYTYTKGGAVLKFNEIDRYEQAFRFRFSNSTASQYWILLTGALEHQMGAREV